MAHCWSAKKDIQRARRSAATSLVVLAFLSASAFAGESASAPADESTSVFAGESASALTGEPTPSLAGQSGLVLPGESGSALSGRFSIGYVPRWIAGTETGDEDMYADLSVDWGGTRDTFSGSIHYRGMMDLNGVSDSPTSRFHSVYDTYGDGWFGQLFHAYADVRSEGFIRSTRIGRQYIYDGHPFHFDGIRVQTARGPMGLQASVFGGVPVHYFKDASSGDQLAGLSVEMRPWSGGRLTALYAHIEDDASFAGLPQGTEADDLYVLSAASRLSDWGSALIRYTGVDNLTRDVLVRAQASWEQTDSHVTLSYVSQPSTLREFTTDLSVFDVIAGESHPYNRIDVSVSQGLVLAGKWRTSLDVRSIVRSLQDSDDEGEYNRDYSLFWIGVGIEAKDYRSFSASVGQASWSSSGDSVDAWDAEVRWRPIEKLRLSLGTSYSLYRYDVLSLEEQTGVRETFVKAQWELREQFSARARFAAEEYDDGQINKLELGCSVLF